MADRVHRLHVRYWLASLGLLAGLIAGVALGDPHRPLALPSLVPFALAVGCAVLIHRTANQIERVEEN
jgi:hypothetical protein